MDLAALSFTRCVRLRPSVYCCRTAATTASSSLRTGSENIVLAQVYRADRSTLADDWLYNSRKQWRKRTGLGDRKIENACAEAQSGVRRGTTSSVATSP
jgi:hypothetical protein